VVLRRSPGQNRAGIAFWKLPRLESGSWSQPLQGVTFTNNGETWIPYQRTLSTCVCLCVRACVSVWAQTHPVDSTHHHWWTSTGHPFSSHSPSSHPYPSACLSALSLLLSTVCVCVCVCYRWGRDGCVLTRQQQQQQRQPVETKAGWFIAPYREHKSHLQRRAFKRPASWQHLPFINDWAEPPVEPETTKLTHSPSNSPFVSPSLSPSLRLISIFSPYLSHKSFCLFLPHLAAPAFSV